jgi:transcriptional regulator with XRE-family HTH domain
VSVSYYVALEQGRGAQPSAEIADALATALSLDATGRAHLRTLAGTVPGAPEVTAPSTVPVIGLDPPSRRSIPIRPTPPTRGGL